MRLKTGQHKLLCGSKSFAHLFVRWPGSAAGCQRCCSLTDARERGWVNRGMKISDKTISVPPEPEARIKNEALTILAFLLVRAVAALRGRVALQSWVQAAAVFAGELLRGARGVAFFTCSTQTKSLNPTRTGNPAAKKKKQLYDRRRSIAFEQQTRLAISRCLGITQRGNFSPQLKPGLVDRH